MLTITADRLPLLMNCNGSRLLPHDPFYAQIDATVREEGNAADWLATQWFKGAIDHTTIANTKAPNGVVITDQMVEHVGEYLAALDTHEVQAETSFGNDIWRVNGRCDHWDYSLYDNTLTIDDLKYGWRAVEPENNWTLLAHAIGLCIFHRLTPRTIQLRIHQPRPWHPDGKLRTWTISYAELMAYYEQINATLTNPSDQLTTGLSWCGHCPSLTHCPAARLANMNAIDAASVPFTDDIPDEALSHELDVLTYAEITISTRKKALEELTAYRLRQGRIIDNYANEPQYANTRWVSGMSGPILSALTKIDCVKPGTITPAEFKRRGGSEAVYNALTERPMVGTKLVRISADERAKRLFGKKGKQNAN